MDGTKWVTKNGQAIHVYQMSDSHLLNCIAKIRRDAWRVHWLRRLEDAARYRGLRSA